MAEPARDPAKSDGHLASAATRSGTARRLRLAMMLVLVAGLGGTLAVVRSATGRQRLAGAITTYVIAHGLLSSDTVSTLEAVYRWRVLHVGVPAVSPGCGNWLFLTEETLSWDGAEHAMAERADAMRRIADRLRARNVAVIFALVPDKARIEQAQLCGVSRSVQERGRYDAFIGLVQARGLQIVDVRQAFSAVPDPGSLYLRTDSHWSQRGAAVAAAAIAAAVPPNLIAHDDAWTITPATVATTRVGDLLRIMGLGQVADVPLLRLRPAPDNVHAETAAESSLSTDNRGLLDTAPGLQVILLGSSYSVKSHFHEHLEQALSTRIGQFGIDGGGFSVSARTYFANAAWRDTPPKLIIWEFPERAIPQPLTPNERAFVDGKDTSGIAK